MYAMKLINFLLKNVELTGNEGNALINIYFICWIRLFVDAEKATNLHWNSMKAFIYLGKANAGSSVNVYALRTGVLKLKRNKFNLFSSTLIIAYWCVRLLYPTTYNFTLKQMNSSWKSEHIVCTIFEWLENHGNELGEGDIAFTPVKISLLILSGSLVHLVSDITCLCILVTK